MNKNLTALRNVMKERGTDAYIITSADAHASEYTAAFWRGREWVSGFTGSAGLLVVTAQAAGLWTDGRYFIQAERELADSGIALFKTGVAGVISYTDFLAENLPAGGKLGFDGRTITVEQFAKIEAALRGKNISFAYEDLLCEIWRDRHNLPQAAVFEHPPQFACHTAEAKLAAVREKMREKNIAAYLVTAPESVAWLANIRGGDIPNTPVAYAFSLITPGAAVIFIDPKKLAALPDFEIREYDALPKFLATLETVHFNPRNTNVLLADAIPKKAELSPAEDIIPLIKAAKTPAEIANIKNAFIREGVAMTKMLAWLDGAVANTITEGDVVRVLQKFRREQEHYLCDSFDTISAYGANAAQAHYNSGEIGTTIQPHGFLLVDTGGQYLDGTTDTTRTVCLGKPTAEMRRDFTLVLQGNIALTTAIFPKGTTGSALDVLARAPLWESGQNYGHGTGHGVGYCLSVHEGPQNISQVRNEVALVAGMLISCEPAVYKENRYGIRTENILYVRENSEASTFLAFETLTRCPIDIRAVDAEMLTPRERAWLNDYHAKTRAALSPHLSPNERAWLERATAPLANCDIATPL